MPEKDEERKRILTLISLFQEEEEDDEGEQEQEDENEGGKAQSEKEKRDKIECEKSPAGEEEEAKMNASPRGPNPKGNQKNGIPPRSTASPHPPPTAFNQQVSPNGKSTTFASSGSSAGSIPPTLIKSITPSA